MGRIDRRVLWGLWAAVFFVVAGLALAFANDWWLSGILTLSILCWLAAMLAAIYGEPKRRPLLIAAIIASAAYMLLAAGPWFRVHVGPWLVTTQGLTAFEVQVLGRQPPQQAYSVATGYPVNWTLSGGSTFVDASSYIMTPGATPTVIMNVPASAMTGHFQAVGHWVFGWLAAFVAALAVGWLQRRRQSKTHRLAAGANAKEQQP